jgi:hypothetical protein
MDNERWNPTPSGWRALTPIDMLGISLEPAKHLTGTRRTLQHIAPSSIVNREE